ncbi:MAG: T9SS type A sorting domain-containing protein [Bacteroidota bacterium]
MRAFFFFLCLSGALSLAAQTDSVEAYPNPFCDSTMIRIILHQTDTVNLTAFSMNGAVVKVIYQDTVLRPGTYLSTFDGTSLDQGIYILRFSTGTTLKIYRIVKSCSPQSIDSDPLSNSLSFFPNPVSHILNIPFEGKKRVTVMGANGQLVRSEWITENSIDLSGIEAGVYWVRVNDEQGRVLGSERVVKLE